jgi:hypothetical protein
MLPLLPLLSIARGHDSRDHTIPGQWNEYNWNASFNRKLDAQLCKSPPVFPRKNKHCQTKYFYAISFDRVETPKKTRFREIKTNFVITFG